ncbi:carbamoyltransferase, partial [Candidatus Pelagibacter sp.]|nr:carbamoyltransferase [Candidatus Pelagibacter sp.]
MNIVLGLNCNHADSSACIIKENKLVFGIEEERLNRVKHWAGVPVMSIKECLLKSNTNLDEITEITVNTNPSSSLIRKGFYFLKNYIRGKKKYEILSRLKKKFDIINEINKSFTNVKLSKKVKIKYIDHHLSHISSAFYPSGFENAIGLSIDGFGDFVSMAIAECNQNGIKIVKKKYFPDSMGVFYEAFTQLIGFHNYGDEYKFMGLSSYGNPIYSELIKKNIFKDFKKLELNLNYFSHTDKNYVYKFSGKPKQDLIFNKKILELFSIESFNKIIEDEKLKKDIASSVQKVFEDKVIEICEEIKNLNYSENLVYAGGCALNSLANRKIIESNIFKNVFIPYSPGDGGGSIGSAVYFLKKNRQTIKNLESPYIGPGFTNEEIKKIISSDYKNLTTKFELILNKNQLNNEIVDMLIKNRVIGYFNGRMEFGARALGNRSIIANPCDINIKDIINSKIKKRENFRPFAPSILNEEKDKWFYNCNSNPYMSIVENIKKDKRKLIPAVTHIDGTGRVQTVSKSMNENFYNLIQKFFEISNVPIILNTSFNENEPIVNKPGEAIECFLRTEMD